MPLEKTPRVTINGINALTGTYDVPQLNATDFARRLRRSPGSARVAPVATDRGRRLEKRAFPLSPDIPPDDLTKTGWGVVFHVGEDSAVKRVLERLIEHRRAVVNDQNRIKVLAYTPDDTVESWLSQYNVAWGNVEPTLVPYYLLFVSSPSRIPYQFAQTLDAEYCVGLLDLPSPAAYEQYVDSVIAYEKAAAITNTKEIVYFGTKHPFDEATALSAEYLIKPLFEGQPSRSQKPVADDCGFSQRRIVAKDATRAALRDVVTGANGRAPAILFTATHGMVWPNGDEHQPAGQGALLCQDWNGLGKMAREYYFAAADVPGEAKLSGVIAFLFACYGAGTPNEDRYAFEPGTAPPAIAPRAFPSALPVRLLTHPAGGALACIGHIERAWGFSIVGQTNDPQLGPFRRALWRLMKGQPVGLAVQEFNDKCATASVQLANLLEKAYAGRPVDDTQLTTTWAERNDAEGYVAIGDPAVRLRPELLKA
jgi:hypothetical protein